MSARAAAASATLATLFAVLLTTSARAAPQDAPLPSDDRNVVGRFDNGVHYLIRPNVTPPGRVCAYLHVRTGALNETDAQNGLAHFIEHMAFNGSTNFKPGSLVPLLQHLGMRFGADTNAHTTLHETVFKLNLPDNDPQRIDLAMKIFADYAYGLTLSPAEIDSERRVILEEARASKGAGERIQKLARQSLFADTRLAVHDVIGDEALIKTFPQSEFQDYWNAWYRPENMTVVVVGDVKPDDVIPIARKWLGTFAARAPARQPMHADIKPTPETRAFVFSDPEQVATSVELTRLAAPRPTMKTVGDFRVRLLDAVAASMFNRRMQNRVAGGDAPFRAGGVQVSDVLHEATSIGAEANGEAADWNKILDGLVTELNRAIEHGFGADELDLVKRSMLESADESVRTDPTRDSSAIINSISNAIGLNEPLLSAEQQRMLLRDALSTLTVDEVNRAFGDAFRSPIYNYVVVLPPPHDGTTLPTPQDVMAAAAAAWAKHTDPPSTRGTAGQLVAVDPDAGAIASTETDPELKLTTTTFANGVVMHHMLNTYRKDQVGVRITLAGGQIEEDAATRGVTEMAALVFGQPATDRLSSIQIRDLLAGKSVGFGGSVSLDAVTLNITGSPRDLRTGMQLAYALLNNGRIEPSAVANWKRSQIQAIGQRDVQASGQLQRAIAASFYGGDPRLRPLTAENVEHLAVAQAQAWFDHLTHDQPIEVAIVGDLSLQDATELVARYLGSLPKRTHGFADLDHLRNLSRAEGPFKGTVAFSGVTPQAVAMAGFVSCDQLDPDRRPLSLAANVLTDRMISQVRKRDQLVYSIAARNDPGRGLPGIGIFSASSTTDPANAQRLADELIEMMQEFADKGPTADELATAKIEIAKELESGMREPAWWLSQIGDLTYRGRPLADLKQLPGVFDRYTPDDVRSAFAKYMKPNAIVRYAAIPKSSTTLPATLPATQPAR